MTFALIALYVIVGFAVIGVAFYLTDKMLHDAMGPGKVSENADVGPVSFVLTSFAEARRAEHTVWYAVAAVLRLALFVVYVGGLIVLVGNI